MAYYYVKSGLTGTGDQGRYASQQIGAFPTGTGGYDNIVAALGASTAPTHGDFICVSDTHSHNYVANTTYSNTTNSNGTGITIISVDDTACEDYKRGAGETSDDVYYIRIDGYYIFLGIDFAPGGNFSPTGQQDQIYYDCTFTAGGSGDSPFLPLNNTSTTCVNCTFNFNHISAGEIDFNHSLKARFSDCIFTKSLVINMYPFYIISVIYLSFYQLLTKREHTPQ